MKLSLPNVTLVIIDCINLKRAQIACNISQKYVDFGEIKILSHLEDGKDKRIIKINKIDNINDYSLFCIKKLDDHISTDYCLLIQYDGFVLKPEFWKEDFLKYDFIGAPIFMKNEGKRDYYFNGGFSLRSKKLLDLLKKDDVIQLKENYGEDYLISNIYKEYLLSRDFNFPPKDIAAQFSADLTSIKKSFKNIQSFGFHGLNIDLKDFFNRNPEFINLKKYFKNEVHILKVVYSKTLSIFKDSPVIYRFLRKILLFVKKVYYKYFY